MAGSLTDNTRMAPYSASALATVSSASPNTTATGSPSLRASVRSSSAGLETCESTCSATMRTSDIQQASLSQMYLPMVRNSTKAADPALSSSTMMRPGSLGGRGVVWRTLLQALSRPTELVPIPRSASAQVSTGFFLAARMPFIDGYRASPD